MVMTFDRMKEVQRQIEEELEGAYNYASRALELKSEEPRFANAYLTMAQQEVGHYNVLHGLATESIKSIEGASEHYETMKDVYQYLHARLMDKAAKVNTMIAMFKED